ncbi:DUF3598 family protein [Halovivax limisalsi]|uniref:DUF3598 family protein n=1 Tax=Halovivax limisalsi TaxID=1453760 RepID=UPI001FFCB5BB|nr:DUF3598 family protein [Halovivax limisalsi]
MAAADIDLKSEMPTLALLEGAWEGKYVMVDPDEEEIKRADSRVTTEFPEDGEYPYRQVNEYEWDDGTSERYEFPGSYEDGRLDFDTERMTGHAWEAEHAERTTLVRWTRSDLPNSDFFEMTQVNERATERARIWHWFKDDELEARMIIQEYPVEE